MNRAPKSGREIEYYHIHNASTFITKLIAVNDD